MISEINFKGFKDTLDSGKIVVLNMNIAEYKNLSKIIAAYLKLDFQAEVLSRLSNGNNENPPTDLIALCNTSTIHFIHPPPPESMPENPNSAGIPIKFANICNV